MNAFTRGLSALGARGRRSARSITRGAVALATIVRLDAIVQLDPLRDRVLLTVRGVASTLSVSVHRTAAFRGWVGLG